MIWFKLSNFDDYGNKDHFRHSRHHFTTDLVTSHYSRTTAENPLSCTTAMHYAINRCFASSRARSCTFKRRLRLDLGT
jgi:hypothetical protein